MFWNMLAQSSRTLWPVVTTPVQPAPEPEPEKPRVGRPDRGRRAEVKAGRKAARARRR